MAGRLTKSGYPVQLVDQRQVRLLEPNLKGAPSLAVYTQREGAIDAKLTTDLLTRAIRQTGAAIHLGNPVLSLMTEGSRITGVVTATGKLRADRVVLATGVATNTLCQSLGVSLPINVSPATLLTFEHAHPFVHRIISSPLMEIRTASATLTLAAEESVEEPTAANLQALAHSSLEKIKYHWRDAESIKLQRVVVGNRAIPQDGLPIIGRLMQLESLYIVVMHAGVTLASVVGRLASNELLSDEEDALLSPYRPIRFC
jgi:glycine/D-amino acid oxidase-like deaminating enzyme